MIFSTQLYFISLRDIPATLALDIDTAFVFTNHGTHYEKLGFGTKQGNIFELSIQYKNEQTLDYIIDLFCAAYTVVSAYNYFNYFDFLPTLNNPIPCASFQGNDEAYLACLLVQKCYKNQSYKNAICKFHVAHETFSLHPMELHPDNEPIKRDMVLTEYIRIANVIITCYSIIEELGLQIIINKLSDGTLESSVIQNGNAWNPTVLKRLRETLLENGINPNMKIVWISRNELLRPFKHKVVDNNNPCTWNNNTNIKDFNITITDAILELSHMRSRLASHRIEERVLKLAVYDAENAFHLARILLLNFFQIELS